LVTPSNIRKNGNGLRLIAAVAILAVAMAAGGSILCFSEESDAVGEKWSVSSNAGAIVNGSINPVDQESTTLTHTVTIKANTGCFVPAKSANNDEVQLDGVQTGVTGAQVVAGSYTPNADRTSATVQVKVETITTDHAKVNIKCTCVKGAVISFTANITSAPAIEQMKVAPGADYKVTLTTSKISVTGYDLKTAKLTRETDTQSVDLTSANDKTTFTIPAKYLVSDKTVTAQMNYTLHVYEVKNGNLKNLVFSVSGTKEYNSRVTITIKGVTGYHAPTTGVTAEGGSKYDYTTAGEGNAVIGTITIPNITSDITLYGTGVANTYKITYFANALDVGKVPVKFNQKFHTYTYGTDLFLPTSPNDQINHFELIYQRCVDDNGNTITKIPGTTLPNTNEIVISIIVEDNMDYADEMPKNITMALCIVAAAVMTLVLVVVRR